MRIVDISYEKKKRYHQILTLLYIRPMKQREIAQKLGLSKSWVSELLSEMEEKKLIERETIGRANIVRITERGKAFFPELRYAATPDLLRVLVEETLRSLNIEYERSIVIDGISFDFVFSKRSKLIKIVKGLRVRLDIEVIKSIADSLLDNMMPDIRRSELIEILRDLIDEKGAILTTMRYAMSNPNRKILLIIVGEKPESWPEALVRIIDRLGELTHQDFVINAHKALKRILANKPSNLEIVFAAEISIEKFLDLLKKFILSNQNITSSNT